LKAIENLIRLSAQAAQNNNNNNNNNNNIDNSNNKSNSSNNKNNSNNINNISRTVHGINNNQGTVAALNDEKESCIAAGNLDKVGTPSSCSTILDIDHNSNPLNTEAQSSNQPRSKI
jgi:hypothetical protein